MRSPRFSAIESLEARIAPATLIWDGSVGDRNWFNPQNWDQNIVPGPSDTAILSIDSQIALSASTSVAEFRQSNGTFSSPAGVTFTATSFVWTGGSQEGAGTTVVDGTLEISGFEDKRLSPDSGAGRTLINNGVGNFTGVGTLFLGGSFQTLTEPGSQLINNGTFNARDEAGFGTTGFGGASNPAIITNSAGATFNKSGEGTGVLSPFINAGTINVDSGTLILADGSNTGLISVDADASLEFSFSSEFTFEAGGTLKGLGNLSLRDAVVSVFGAFELTGTVLVMEGGTLDFNTLSPTLRTLLQQDAGSTVTGSGNITITEFFTWSGGTQAGSGTTTYVGDGGAIGGDDAKVLNQRTLNNHGTFTWSEGSGNVNMSNGAVFNNRGSFTILGSDASWIDTQTGAESVFRNLVGGTMSAPSEFANTSTFDVRFENAGEIAADNLRFIKSFSQSDGETFLDGGRVDGGITFNFTGGKLTGSGTITGDVINSAATVAPGRGNALGTLTITGNYTQGAAGALEVAIAGAVPGTQHDQLSVSGTVSINGTLTATLVDGFTPTPSDLFNVLAATTRTGTFSTSNVPSPLVLDYMPTQVQLRVDPALPTLSISPNGKSVRASYFDGSEITIKTNRGELTAENFVFAPDGKTLEKIDLRSDASFSRANLSITAKSAGGGNGVVDVGLVDATNLDLGKVTIGGTLGRIIVGDDDPKKPAAKSLTVDSLGTNAAVTEPLLSEVHGSLGKLTVKGDVRGASVDVQGKLGKVTIAGDLVGETGLGAQLLAVMLRGNGLVAAGPAAGIPVGSFSAGSVGSFTVKGNMNGGSVATAGNIGSVNVGQDLHGAALAAAGQIKVVKVFRDLYSDDPNEPVMVAALARVGSTKPAGAVAIDTVKVNGDVKNAQILLGYKKEEVAGETQYVPRNPDASSGNVVVKGDWSASSLVAGVFDATDDGFGRNDVLVEGDVTPRLLARIASIVIKGTATGSAAEGDHYAITAQKIGKLSIDGQKVLLDKDTKDDVLLDPTNGDFRLVEV